MEPLSPHRQQVEALFGRCLLRLQQYELLMKRLIANYSLTTSASSVAPTDPKLAKTIGTSTLGLVAKTFFETFVVVAGRPDTVEKKLPAELQLTTIVCIEMTLQDYEAAKISVTDLVELRNTLVHYFVDLFDLWSEAGCEKASEYLIASCDRIQRELEQLQNWATSTADVRRRAAEFLRSDAAEDFIINGIGLDGVVDWTRAGIVASLIEAHEVCAIDGWTPLQTAIEFSASRYPEQTPQKYKCRSWPQVLHDSKRFELRYTLEPGAAKVALYRERPIAERRSA